MKSSSNTVLVRMKKINKTRKKEVRLFKLKKERISG